MYHLNNCKTEHKQADISEQKLKKTSIEQVMMRGVF